MPNTKKQEKYLLAFSTNLKEGINYYSGMFSNVKDKFEDAKSGILGELEASKKKLQVLRGEIENLLG